LNDFKKLGEKRVLILPLVIKILMEFKSQIIKEKMIIANALNGKSMEETGITF